MSNKKRLTWTAGLALSAVACAVVLQPAGSTEPTLAPAPPAKAQGPRTELLVGLAPGAQASALAAALNGRVIRHLPDLECALVEVHGKPRVMAERMSALTGATYAEVNRTAIPAAGRGRCVCQGTTGTPPPALEIYDLDRVGELLNLREAWFDAPKLGEGVLVAVVDTGVERSNAALAGATEPVIDLVEDGGEGIDRHGHGTAMSGIIAGRGDGEKQGFVGVAPKARILPVRVAGDRGDAPIDRVARGITAATDRGAKVIYVGLGVRGHSKTLAKAIAYARAAGSLVVCPTGNDGLDALRSPAAETGALAVAGTSGGDALSLHSNLNGDVLLAAPSEYVPAPHREHVRLTDGTSSSGALVAGVAALVLSKNPALDVDALERALIGGAVEIPEVRAAAELNRLKVRRLDAARAVARAGAANAEVVISRLEVTPNPPTAGQSAKLLVTLRNQGHVSLSRVDVSATVNGNALSAPPAARNLAPGTEQVVAIHWKPAQDWAEHSIPLNVRAFGVPEVTGKAKEAQLPATPSIANSSVSTYPTAKAEPNFAIASIKVTQPMTLETPTVVFEVTLENRGASASRGTFQAAINGSKVHKAPVSLVPGGRMTEVVSWTAPNNVPPSAPITLEAYVEGRGDRFVADDLDTFVVSLQDPTLPSDPMYRQDADIDFGLDAPWRLAGDKSYVPLLFFTPSIGRPSRYDTFHETLAMRRGVVGRVADNPNSGRLGSSEATIKSRAKAVGVRTGTNLLTYTSAMFVKELASAAQGDDAALRTFFDRMITWDFAIDFSAYAVGAGTGAYLFDRVHARASKLRGLRWTGSNLGGAIARSQATIALGYLLPNLIRGRFDRRVAIDLASLGLTTAAMETLSAGITAGATRVGLASRTAAWLAKHKKIAKGGGFAVNVGQLVLILYASEWLSESVDRPWIKWDAKKALTSTYEDLVKATEGRNPKQVAQSLQDFHDAFDSYRSIVSWELEDELKTLNKELKTSTRAIFQEDLTNKKTERTLANRNLSANLQKSIERVRKQREARNNDGLRATLSKFEDAYTKALEGLYSTRTPASLNDPGTSKPALYDLEISLISGLLIHETTPASNAKELLTKSLKTTRRLRTLELKIADTLTANAVNSGDPVRPETLIGTDGMRIKKISVTARSSWHQETEKVEWIKARPNKWAPLGSIKEREIYNHDIDRDLFWAAPGVKRVNEMMEEEENVALFDMPRPITVKGRYNMLRVPRALFESVATGGTAYIHIKMEWELTKVVRGTLMRPANGTFSQMLYVHLGDKGLPMLPGVPGAYLDAHYHTIAEWYSPEPGFIADLELDAPRQKYGGPIPMLVECANAVGAIDGPSYGSARDKLITTDHNAFYVASAPGSDTIAQRPPFGPTSAGASGGKTEHEVMRQLLGESAGEELCYQKEGLNIPGVNVGVHMLDYRAKHYDGTWNAQIQNTKFWTRWTNPFSMPTMDKVLSDFAAGADGNENAFSYASHPVSEIPWAYGQNDLEDKMRSALSDYYRVGDKSFPYKGMQVWNARGARHHSMRMLYKYLDDLNPFISRNWQQRDKGNNLPAQPWDAAIQKSFVVYRDLVREFTDFRHPMDPEARMIRKHYMIAGSDSHGDFNYTVGGTATAITAVAGVNDLTDDTFEVQDSAFMKIRTFVGTEGFEGPERMTALAHGSSAVTDGPLVWFELDGDGRFDATKGDFSLNAKPVFKDREGKIGGSGDWDGGRTVLVANDARPVIRYSYTNFDEFGRPVKRNKLDQVTQRDGSIEEIKIYKIDQNATGVLNGTLATKGGRAFGKIMDEPLNIDEEGLIDGVSAIQLGAFSTAVAETQHADKFRCVTNPVWAVQVKVTAHIDQALFDAATGVIQPGGLQVEIDSPISLAADKIPLVIRPINAEGVAFGKKLAMLEPQGWAEGSDGKGKPYRNGLYRAANKTAITIKGLPTFGTDEAGKAMVTLCVMTRKAPRDLFGNKLNRIASVFEINPTDAAAGEFADNVPSDQLTEVNFKIRRGLIEVMGE